MDKSHEEKFHQRGYTDGKRIHEKMFSIVRNQENENWNHDINTRLSEWLKENIVTTQCWQGCGETGSLIHCQQEYQMTQPFWKIMSQFLIKLNMQLPCSQGIPFLRIYPRKIKSFVHTQTYMWIFITAFSVIVKNWNTPDGLQWMND